MEIPITMFIVGIISLVTAKYWKRRDKNHK